jgi:hypothetical protein
MPTLDGELDAGVDAEVRGRGCHRLTFVSLAAREERQLGDGVELGVALAATATEDLSLWHGFVLRSCVG